MWVKKIIMAVGWRMKATEETAQSGGTVGAQGETTAAWTHVMAGGTAEAERCERSYEGSKPETCQWPGWKCRGSLNVQ